MEQTEILSGTDENIRRAAEELRRGGLVALPTETVYGLAAIALDERAVIQIYEVKERPLFDPLILHLPPSWKHSLLDHGLIDASGLSDADLDSLQTLTSTFWPGPLTLVLPKTPVVPDLVTSGLPSVAIRIPSHPLTQHLLEIVGGPLAAPSANRFGRISPTSAEDVVAELGGRIRYVIDGGRCDIGLESTVVRIGGGGDLQLLRPGRIGAAELERVTGRPVLQPDTAMKSGEAQSSPGRLESHYAPAKEMVLLEGLAADEPQTISESRSAAVLFFSERSQGAFLRAAGVATLKEAGIVASRILADSGDPVVAAHNLFRMLRELDASDAQLIVAEPPPEDDGISLAIRDRLSRAAQRLRGPSRR